MQKEGFIKKVKKETGGKKIKKETPDLKTKEQPVSKIYLYTYGRWHKQNAVETYLNIPSRCLVLR